MTTTPQNTSNSGSELDDILDDALNTIQAYVQDEIQDDNGYPPFYGDGETFERVKSNAIAAINRLYIRKADVVEGFKPVTRALEHDVPGACYSTGPLNGDTSDSICLACDALRVLTKLGLSGEQEGE